ncbi:hypothetical protein ASswx1_45 [Aeromonas phage Asswx_1]|uniref:Uncharacterized protein n=1 Tax=Aeromonas phage Asswx_1 TaxID=2419739 RepID=A0A411B7U7_9CAUD|nr:hypothetical protein ASswx1_45 [Aeromonas phage Asswx_1]
MAKKEIVETRCGIDFYLNKFNEKCSTRNEIMECERDWIGCYLPKKYKYVVMESDGLFYAYSKKPVLKQYSCGLGWGVDSVQGSGDNNVEVWFNDSDFGWKPWYSGYCKIEG